MLSSAHNKRLVMIQNAGRRSTLGDCIVVSKFAAHTEFGEMLQDTLSATQRHRRHAMYVCASPRDIYAALSWQMGQPLWTLSFSSRALMTFIPTAYLLLSPSSGPRSMSGFLLPL